MNFTANKIKQLEERIKILIEKYKAVSNQHDRDLDEGNKVIHKKKLEIIEKEIKKVEQEKAHHENEVGTNELEITPKPKPPKLPHLLPVFLGAGTIVLLVGLIFYILEPLQPRQETVSEKLCAVGASHTLQIIATLKDGNKRYGSATVWKETEEDLILVTAYHILQGVKEFEIAAPHYDQKTNDFKCEFENRQNISKIPSSKFEIDAKRKYNLVFIRLALSLNKEYAWLSKVGAVKNEACDLFETEGKVFGFSSKEGLTQIYTEATFNYSKESEQTQFCPPCIKKLLHFDSKTQIGMGGGPVLLNNTDCFLGILIGYNRESDKTIAMKYHIGQIYSSQKFKAFSEDQFIKESCLKYREFN